MVQTSSTRACSGISSERRAATAIAQWGRMAQEQRREAANQQRRFQNLTRQERQLINQRFRLFNALSAEQQT